MSTRPIRLPVGHRLFEGSASLELDPESDSDGAGASSTTDARPIGPTSMLMGSNSIGRSSGCTSMGSGLNATDPLLIRPAAKSLSSFAR
jgi:hypothetical protein